ncbi:hypothetical protein DFP72DRAFT_856779 [Ephemerocybe angulata]|uniref:Uncharacterized protein n=1 Tax=Ephemerocybe angulata TaxID=980116 RepID=A0A8H6HF31_9AGAR|nr:hypothetical protein DFP72DRAFT_856779 [Tulosesus angulatus]
MSLGSGELQELAIEISSRMRNEYIFLAFSYFYLYYYLSTLSEEVQIIPFAGFDDLDPEVADRKGSVPLESIPSHHHLHNIISMYRINVFFVTPSPRQANSALSRAARCIPSWVLVFTISTERPVSFKVIGFASEWDLTLNGDEIDGQDEQALTVPALVLETPLFGELSRGAFTYSAAKKYESAGYISLAKVICIMSALVLFIFSVRYKNQEGTLLHILRRDSGAHVLAVVGWPGL